MFRLLLCLLLTLPTQGQTASFDDDTDVVNGVTTLHSYSFRPFIASHRYACILFGRSILEDARRALRELYHSAPDLSLRDRREVNIGHLDCDKYQDICSEQHILSVPSFIVYVAGRPYEYRGREFGARRLERFIDDAINRNATLISKPVMLEHILTSKRAFIVYFRGEVSVEELQQQIDIVNAVAVNHLEFKFYFTRWSNTTDGHGEVDPFSQYNFVVHRRFGDRNGSLASNVTQTAEELEAFLNKTKRPDVVELDTKTNTHIFQSKRPTAFLFYSNPEDQGVKDFTTVAPEFKSHLLFVRVNSTDYQYGRVREFMGVSNKREHLVKILDHHGGEARKFRLKKWNEATLRQFFSDYLAGKLSPYYKTTRPPKHEIQEAALVKTVVGSTFKEMVLDSSDNVLMVAYLGDQATTASTFIEFFKQYLVKLEHAVGKHFVPMLFDANLNDHPAFHYKDFPAILLYKAGEKDRPKRMHGHFVFGNVVRFLERHLGRMRYAGEDKIVPIDGSL
jgi:hypothetical protein